MRGWTCEYAASSADRPCSNVQNVGGRWYHRRLFSKEERDRFLATQHTEPKRSMAEMTNQNLE